MKRGFLLGVFFFGGCAVGPNYQPPIVIAPSTWKEADTGSKELAGDWWKIFGDATLNELEEKALQANQDLKRAALRVDEARAIARVNKADFYPDVSANPSYSRTRYSGNRPNPTPFPQSGFTGNDVRVPFDLSYEVDIWGRVRRSFEAAVAESEASLAVYRTVQLTLTSDLAQNYFRLRSLDSERILLNLAAATRKDALEIAHARYEAGLTNMIEVNRAETELANTEAEIPDVERQRSEIEHAMAVLCGKTPAEFSVAFHPIDLLPPKIPAGLPSELLQHRPDLIEAERLMASASARIGIAKAAFFPSIRLTGMAGFESAELSSVFDWESRVWSLGPSISVPIFQGGRNAANLKAAESRYEQSVAQFRQKVLIAFREVEDALVNLRLRAEQADSQARAILAVRETTELVKARYKDGVTRYDEVIDSMRTQLQSERTATQILGQRLAYTILLVKALGGGWGEQESLEQSTADGR